LEKTFEVNRRFQTWLKNNDKWNLGKNNNKKGVSHY
jgi:hypothetical protein